MKKIFSFFAALTMVMPMFAAQETVYFVNAHKWAGTINAYAWTTNPNASWPGAAATKEAEQIAGFDVYSFTAEAGKYANVIFNNGSQQTADLKWTAGKYYCKDGWYTKEEAAAKLGQPVEYESVYFVNVQEWSKVKIYTWGPEVGTWPGVDMTKENEKIGGKEVYSYTVEKGSTFGGMLFNCGGDECKTGDLKWTAGKYYVKDGWYTKAEAEEKLVGPGANLPTVVLAGEMNNWDLSKNVFNTSKDLQTASAIVALDAQKTYAFKIVVNGAWLGNTGKMERSNCTGWLFEALDGEETNAHIIADVAGDYTFTWTYADSKLTVTYPNATTALENVVIENNATKVIRNGQMYILRDGLMYNIVGQVAE